jgi:hypothetical protein
MSIGKGKGVMTMTTALATREAPVTEAQRRFPVLARLLDDAEKPEPRTFADREASRRPDTDRSPRPFAYD